MRVKNRSHVNTVLHIEHFTTGINRNSNGRRIKKVHLLKFNIYKLVFGVVKCIPYISEQNVSLFLYKFC